MSKRGGMRPGSGPKKSMSAYGESTFLVRMPVSVQPKVLVFLDEYKKLIKAKKNGLPELPKAALNPPILELPIYTGKIAAGATGFPSPAQDYEDGTLDLNRKLIRNPSATVFFQVGDSYDSMVDAKIYPNDILIVDRSLDARTGDIVVAVVEGEFMVKRFYRFDDRIELRSENKLRNYPPIVIKGERDFSIEGVVLNGITSF